MHSATTVASIFDDAPGDRTHFLYHHREPITPSPSAHHPITAPPHHPITAPPHHPVTPSLHTQAIVERTSPRVWKYTLGDKESTTAQNIVASLTDKAKNPYVMLPPPSCERVYEHGDALQRGGAYQLLSTLIPIHLLTPIPRYSRRALLMDLVGPLHSVQPLPHMKPKDTFPPYDGESTDTN